MHIFANKTLALDVGNVTHKNSESSVVRLSVLHSDDTLASHHGFQISVMRKRKFGTLANFHICNIFTFAFAKSNGNVTKLVTVPRASRTVYTVCYVLFYKNYL